MMLVAKGNCGGGGGCNHRICVVALLRVKQ
jgi:hypothetical protein